MNTGRHKPGLWALPGDGVLARRGDLIMLSSLEDSRLADTFLDLQAQIDRSGGNGHRLADMIAERLVNHQAWVGSRSHRTEPAVVAFGPAGAGLEVILSGTAWAEISTETGTRRYQAGEPSTLLRCLLGHPVLAVRAGLGAAGHEPGRTDRFSRLDAGTVRAGGLSYYSGHPAAVNKAPPVTEELAEASAAGDDAAPGVPGISGGSAEPAPEVRAMAAGPGGPQQADPRSLHAPSEPAAGRDKDAVSAGAVAEPAEAAAQPAEDGPGPPFEAVVLIGERGGKPVAQTPRSSRVEMLPEQPSSRSGGRQIFGVYCKNGHFDDPEARFCAVCGISMNQRTLVPELGPRPPLGVLVLDAGAVFQLDADYVVGREPTLDTSVATGKARPLRIADATSNVSRVHARIELDDWVVKLTDLGSANGTRIQAPGQATDQMLAPHIGVPLEPGSRVDLGGPGFRYESYRGH